MPAHRHPKHSRGAGKVPPSRLPLGTPAVGGDKKEVATSRASLRSTSSQSSRFTSDLDHHSPSSNKHDEGETSTMPNSLEPSVAETKLRRQKERELRLEALMPPPNVADKASRGKVKGTDKVPEPIRHSERNMSSSDGGVSVGVGVEVRINKYTAASRDTSLSRSMSSVSQQTTLSHRTGTGSFDMERQDSRHDSFQHDNAGFQMYSRQRGARRAPTEQSTFPDKPIEKPKTVEANYDEHEILEVFKKRLPGLDYLTTSPGQADGEVQFVQHPNGDVSAHMWSMRGYEWCNIGSFSNIRKKVEGQLAGDRLKGETAWQKLQQNTLTYFRVLAKQREAGAMGYTFGQEDIKQALPEPHKVMTVATAEPTTEDRSTSFLEPAPGIASSHAAPQAPRLDRPAFPQILHSQAKSDDPFSGSSQTAHPFHGFGSQSSTVGLMGTLSATPPAILSNAGQAPTGSPYLTAKPPMAIGPGRYDYHNSARPTMASRAGCYEYGDVNSGHRTSAIQATAKPYIPGRVAGTAPADPEEKHSYFDPSTPTSHSRSPRSRELRLGQLREIQENAMKRSQSQTNIMRTVMNDPLRANEDSEYDCMSSGYSHYAGSEFEPLPHELLPRDPKADFEEMCKGWTDNQPRIDPADRKTSALTMGSVPDTDYQPPVVPSTHMSLQELRASDDKTRKESNEKSLHEWFTDGNKFSRQEELFKHIMATARPNPQQATPSSTARHTSFGTPSVRPRPIGAPAITSTPPSLLRNATTPQKETAPKYNEQMTRILIPVYENLASYVQGPADQRRDYWCRWVQPPEWAIDRGPNGNASFFDNVYHKPPERVGRDPRYTGFPGELKFGGLSPQTTGAIGTPAGYSSGVSGLVGFGMGGGGGGAGGGGGRYGYPGAGRY